MIDVSRLFPLWNKTLKRDKAYVKKICMPWQEASSIILSVFSSARAILLIIIIF